MEIVNLVFEGNLENGDSVDHLTTHELKSIPHCGDVIKISGMWHYVITTCFDITEKVTSVHLGTSCPSLEKALQWPDKYAQTKGMLAY